MLRIVALPTASHNPYSAVPKLIRSHLLLPINSGLVLKAGARPCRTIEELAAGLSAGHGKRRLVAAPVGGSGHAGFEAEAPVEIERIAKSGLFGNLADFEACFHE